MKHLLPLSLLTLLSTAGVALAQTQVWSAPTKTEQWSTPTRTEQWSAPSQTQQRPGAQPNGQKAGSASGAKPGNTQVWSTPSAGSSTTQQWAQTPPRTRIRTDAENQALVDQASRNAKAYADKVAPRGMTDEQARNVGQGLATVDQAWRRANDRDVAAERERHEADRRHQEERRRRGY